MNRIISARGILQHLLAIGMVATTPGTSSAVQYVVCNGDSGNNQVAVGNPGCETNVRRVDCWEDPAHTPPRWESGKTYARAELRICSTVAQLRSYAFDYLKTTKGLLGGTAYKARAFALDRNGTTLVTVEDTNADGKYTGWSNINNGTAAFILSRAEVTLP
jgi:hypothetical protein